MKSLTSKDFTLILNSLKERILGCRINNITVLNSKEYVLTLSKEKLDRLYINLNHQSPLLGLIKIDSLPNTIIGNLNDTLRKYIKDCFILSIDLVNEDKVFKFELVKSNELFEKVKYYLYIECIPQRPNLIICDNNDVIIYAAHYTSITSNRLIIKNFLYPIIEKKEFLNNTFTTSLKDIENYLIEMYSTSHEKRNNELFFEFFKFLKIRIKSLTKKLDTLSKSSEEARERLTYIDIGNTILSLLNDKDELSSYLASLDITFDESLSNTSLAELCFKKYKKAKRTLEMNEIEKAKTILEIDKLNETLSLSPYLNKEELFSIANEYLPHKYKKSKNYKVPSFIGQILVDNDKILYGKNAKANNELTFKIANKNDYFLHIKDYHGTHAIIKEGCFNDRSLLLAAEICLLMSKKESGEVYYTKKENVKKGDHLGEVNLLHYKTIYLKSIREETKLLLKN